MDPDKNKDLVNAKELAALLSLREGWIRQNMNTIPHHKFNRLVRFDPQAVKEHFKSVRRPE